MKKRLKRCSLASLFLVVMGLAILLPRALFAQADIQTPPLIGQMLTLIFLSLLPWLEMLLTSFLKMVIVLALLRSALGVQKGELVARKKWEERYLAGGMIS